MGKSDELDPRLAAAYAWRVLKPGESLDSDPEPASTPHDDDAKDGEKKADHPTPREARAAASAKAFEELRAESARPCQSLADGIDRAWSLPPEQQPIAVDALVESAGKLGIGLTAMQEHPLQSVRLLRLVIACGDRLSAEADEAARGCALWLDYTHPEIIDALLELSRAGDTRLGCSLVLALHGDRGKYLARIPGASARFARLLDEGPSETTRCMALDWLSAAARQDAVPALRRALRSGQFPVCTRALDLLSRDFPDAIEPDDVLFLLEDAVAHELPLDDRDDENVNACREYPLVLDDVVVRVRPAGGAWPLMRIESGRCAGESFRDGGLDGTWALSLLAAAYPESATPLIDELQRDVEWDRRLRAVEAAGRLPDEAAWPRLLKAAADGVPEIASQAQKRWLARRTEICPLDPLAGVPTSLLEEPPSERLLSRLALLRTAKLEARAAMAEVLLAEAPSPESLVPLLFAAVDTSLWERDRRPGFPENRPDFCRRIIAAFGPRAVTGILDLAELYPEGRSGWLDTLSELVDKNEVPESAFPELRAAAARRFNATIGRTGYRTLKLLEKLGTPPELVSAIWTLSQDETEDHFIRSAAGDVLASLPEHGESLDNAVVDEMTAALAVPDLPRFSRAAAVGVGRKIPAAVTLSLDALAKHGRAPAPPRADVDALEMCFIALLQIAQIPEGWVEDALSRPATAAFAIAARRTWMEPTPDRRRILREALSNGDPFTEAEAAVTLVHLREISASGAEVERIVTRAPLSPRSALVWLMLYARVPMKRLWPLLEGVLVSPDPEVTERFHFTIHAIAYKHKMASRLQALLPRIVDPVLQDAVELIFEAEEPAVSDD
jgi:hypothetical protein